MWVKWNEELFVPVETFKINILLSSSCRIACKSTIMRRFVFRLAPEICPFIYSDDFLRECSLQYQQAIRPNSNYSNTYGALPQCLMWVIYNAGFSWIIILFSAFRKLKCKIAHTCASFLAHRQQFLELLPSRQAINLQEGNTTNNAFTFYLMDNIVDV